MGKQCYYKDCKSNSNIQKRLAFHPFPKPKRRRTKCEEWLRLCGNNKLNIENITQWTYICHKHFTGKFTSDSVPLPFDKLKASQSDVEVVKEESLDTDFIEELNNENVQVVHEESVVNKHYIDTGVQTEESINTLSYQTLKSNSVHFKYFTGLKVLQFEALYAFLDESVMDSLKYAQPAADDYNQYQPFSSKRKNQSWSNRDRLCMTLVRLRRGFTLDELSYFCGASKCNISAIFYTWIQFMYYQMIGMRTEIFEGARNLKEVPPSFQNFDGSNITFVLETVEIIMGMPLNFKQQGITLSNYKHAKTVKFLIGICPSGAITYVSEGFEGAISDRELFENCDLKTFLKENDTVMADRGFQIHDLANELHIKLYTPPLLMGRSSLTAEEELLTNKIARSRVHVERSISLIKSYKILNKQCPILLLPILSSMFTVVCFLVNFEDCLVNC